LRPGRDAGINANIRDELNAENTALRDNIDRELARPSKGQPNIRLTLGTHRRPRET
jgi:hypothetical protein